MNNKLEVMLINESIHQSVITDITTFAVLVAAFYVNHLLMDASVVMQCVLAVAFYVSIYSRVSKRIKKMNPQEALEYLRENYEEDEDET